MPRSTDFSLADIRKIAITALFADDFLFERLVLKGGNALTIGLGLSTRTSLDLDFSIENDFEDIGDVEQRIIKVLTARFGHNNYRVFDIKFEPKPSSRAPDQNPRWGGYLVTFKLMEKAEFDLLSGDMEAIRRQSLVVGPRQIRVFKIDFSKFEYIKGKVAMELDDYMIYVYSPEMIAIEKLRAICQQMPEYTLQKRASARARDFFDIHLVVSKAKLDLRQPEMLELARNIFAAKEVPLVLLAKIKDQREFHRPDWDSVKATTPEADKDFDFYFNFVENLVDSLEAFWNE